MADDTVKCPKCGSQIPLTKALRGEIEGSLRKEIESESNARIVTLREEFEKQSRDILRSATAKAKKEAALELTGAQDELAETAKKLSEAKQNELTLRRREKQLKEKTESLELDVERRLDEARDEIMKNAGDLAAEKHRLKDQEQEKKIADFRQQLDAAQRKLAQGSQQLQGEVAELNLENALRETFPFDAVDPVGKGVRGADVVWTVRTPQGIDCGQIVWESKNTKNWSDGWIAKAKSDLRAQKAALAVLVSVALPKHVQHFGCVDGIWVCSQATAMSVATALRAQLIQVARAREAADGKGSKMEYLYAYVTGTEFRQRVEAMAEAYDEMRRDLNKERTATERMWAKREKQLGRSLLSLAGMHGDLQGIVGHTLPSVATLELPAGDEPLEAGE